MKSKFRKRIKDDNYPTYRSYSNRNHSYSLSNNKFVVPWQMEEEKLTKQL